MSHSFPYTFIACPCTPTKHQPFRPAEAPSLPEESDPDSYEELTFDPRSPRSNFSLFPPENLVFCDVCHQIKCSRCTTEEIVCWYCPACLFETPSSMVRSEGNRCARNCFNCPVCTAPLSVNGLDSAEAGASPSYIMACGYCQWSTLDIGIKFDKPSNIRAQLAKLTNSGKPSRRDTSSEGYPLSPLSASSPSDEKDPSADGPLSPSARFSSLKAFYKSQIASTSISPSDPLPGGIGTSDYTSYSSPSNLNRIMSLYATSSTHPKSKTKTRPAIMRETLTQPEGLLLTSLSSQSQDPQQISTHLSTTHWSSIPSLNQRLTNPPSAPPGTLPNITHLLPQPTHLCTKRSKRCLACRHILIKPDIKVQSIRFRVRLVAMSFVPLIKLVPLPPQPSATPSQPISLSSIPPLVPTNLILTIQNHLFDPITITLSTPAITPGRFSHRITLLCPTFEVGANSDLFDEALNPNLAVPSSKTRGSTNSSSESSSGAVEAGKIWAKGRNWTSVILEIVPASLKAPNPAQKNMSFGEAPKGKENGELGLEDDEDVLEIPIFVHLEYETDLDKAEQREREQQGKPPATSEKRELNYWMVLGVGKVAIV